MSGVQFAIMAIVAAIVTVPTVKFIPRARQSPVFDRVLWGATWLLAFLGAWYAVDKYAGGAPLATLPLEEFARVAGGAIVVGAVVGAIMLNALLWLMDRFMAVEPDEIGEGEPEEEIIEKENDGTNSESQ
jgi:hypothetical protein